MSKKVELYALAGAFLIIAVFAFDWALKGAVHYKKDVLVPDLSGKSLLDALDTLSQAGLGLRKDGAETNAGVPAGTILRQAPLAGAQVREGKIIRVILSQGGETAFVPDVVGRPLRAAEIALRTSGLSLGEIRTQPSIKFEKDNVITQDPPARKVVGKNALVHLTLSDGPPTDGTILMPDFIGKPWDEAQAWAKKSDLKIERVDDPAAAAQEGSITAQTLSPDSPLIPGDNITFTVSTSTGTANTGTFRFEVPQGQSARQFAFVLAEPSGNREFWRGSLEPGTKHDFKLPSKVSPGARVRIFVDGILTEERNLQ